MKANEFVKLVGWEEAKGILEAESFTYRQLGLFSYINHDLDNLKQLVKSHELVEECGGLAKAKERVSREEGLPNPNVFYVLVVSSAIDDVESCKESFHERQNT